MFPIAPKLVLFRFRTLRLIVFSVRPVSVFNRPPSVLAMFSLLFTVFLELLTIGEGFFILLACFEVTYAELMPISKLILIVLLVGPAGIFFEL